jgi:hypothetical protein
MQTERVIHTDLKALLTSNAPFKYAHLIKFERPSRPNALSGKVSTSAERYTYLTDGSRDVIFDDLSTDLNGVANGAQTYIANKVLKVSSFQESVEAKADSCTLTLDANGIGGSVTGSVVITSVSAGVWDTQWTVDLVANGFREGDKIILSGARTGSFNIHSFRASGVVRLTKIDDELTTGTATITATLASEEILSVLVNKNATDYASFINREVYIYRAYFQDGALVGATPDVSGTVGPVLLFRGIITNVTFEDDDSGIRVQWGLTSHWGDFAQVRGRITSDEFHRALDQNGNPQPDSAIKPIYAYDKGFIHSETSLNLLASYTVMVDKITVRTKRGFLGIGTKVKIKTTTVPEERNTALDFQLQAKSIPIIYGVRTLVGTPVFADTLKTDSSTVYMVYALAEGEIGGLYDVLIDGKSLICNNQEDSDARSIQNTEGTVDLICRGRADRGDVLGGTSNQGGTTLPFYDTDDLRDVWNHDFNRNSIVDYLNYVSPSVNQAADGTGKGVIGGESIKLTAPQEITIDFFSGTEDQLAASNLVEIAKAENFKVQNDYWTGSDTSEYWGPNHRLLDTAYVVVKVVIKEGETTVPDLEFVTRGRVLDCYNYDESYAHDERMTSENANNFLLGDTVVLSTGQTVQIIDKWAFARPDGVIETRFRFSADPALGKVDGIPATKTFTMTKSGNVWTMNTFNWVLHSGTIPELIGTTVTTFDPPTTPDVDVTVVFPTTPTLTVGGTGGTGPIVSVFDDDGTIFRDSTMTGDITATGFTTGLY